MLYIPFQGSDILIDALNQAIRDCPNELGRCMSRAMQSLINNPEVTLPECVFEPADDHYARRELYRSDEHGFSVVAMTWGAGQATPVHDHSGMWCVEGVWHGELEITQYEPIARDEGKIQFKRHEPIIAQPGSTGSLIPPHEYHTIANTSDSTAISVHVYRGVMDQCQTFLPTGEDDWYIKSDCNLSLDEAA